MFTKCKRLRISPSSLFFDASFPFWVGCSKFIIFFCMVLIKNDIVNSWISIIYNIKISSKPCRKKLWILDNLSNREILNDIQFTFVNHDLRKISSDKVTPKWLIIKIFRCHLSLVTFAFTTDFRLGYLVRSGVQNSWYFRHGFASNNARAALLVAPQQFKQAWLHSVCTIIQPVLTKSGTWVFNLAN